MAGRPGDLASDPLADIPMGPTYQPVAPGGTILAKSRFVPREISAGRLLCGTLESHVARILFHVKQAWRPEFRWHDCCK